MAVQRRFQFKERKLPFGVIDSCKFFFKVNSLSWVLGAVPNLLIHLTWTVVNSYTMTSEVIFHSRIWIFFFFNIWCHSPSGLTFCFFLVNYRRTLGWLRDGRIEKQKKYQKTCHVILSAANGILNGVRRKSSWSKPQPVGISVIVQNLLVSFITWPTTLAKCSVIEMVTFERVSVIKSVFVLLVTAAAEPKDHLGYDLPIRCFRPCPFNFCPNYRR